MVIISSSRHVRFSTDRSFIREVTHDVHNLQEACQDPATFLESSRVEPMNRCACPTVDDFIEADVFSCVDDIVDQVSVRTAVK